MRPGEQFPTVPVLRRVPDILHGVANSVKRLGLLTQQFLHELRRWRKVRRPDTEHIQDLKQHQRFLKESCWKNWYQAELEDVAKTSRNADVRKNARAWLQLWENHTALGQQLLRQEPVDQPLVEKASAQCWDACRTLGLEGTPWLHVLYAHAWQYTRQWGYIAWCANWGLEGRHRLLKRHYRGCWRGGRRRPGPRYSGEAARHCAAEDLLKMGNAHTITSRMQFPRQRRKPQSKAMWELVQARVAEKVRKAMGDRPPALDDDASTESDTSSDASSTTLEGTADGGIVFDSE